jgi:hypothetical protein
MDAPALDRPLIRRHLAEVEKAWPIRFLGLLPAEVMPSPRARGRINLLAEADPTMSLFALFDREEELSRLLGPEVAIVTTDTPLGQDKTVLAALAPL